MTPGRTFMRVVSLLVICAAVMVACSPTPTPSPVPVAMLPVEVVGVGAIPAGRTSIPGMTIRLTEADVATIGRGEGSVVITLTDAAGARDTISMTGTPAVVAPGSLGVTATLTASNVLGINIVDSDTFNVEQVTISGIRLAVSPEAAPGAIRATITECTGSLAGCAPDRALPSPGSVGTS